MLLITSLLFEFFVIETTLFDISHPALHTSNLFYATSPLHITFFLFTSQSYSVPSM